MNSRNAKTRAWILAAILSILGAVRLLSAQGNQAPSALDTSVYTPAHSSVHLAIEDFLNWRPAPTQPIAFTHKVHLEKGVQCRDCHAGVERGPVATIPSVKLCMTCHSVIATDRPEIKKVAAFMARREEIPWQRVYWFYPSAHVRFNHAPHIRAGVDCRSCHGDLRLQTVAVRSVDLTMGYCLNCHNASHAPTDCTTCHF